MCGHLKVRSHCVLGHCGQRTRQGCVSSRRKVSALTNSLPLPSVTLVTLFCYLTKVTQLFIFLHPTGRKSPSLMSRYLTICRWCGTINPAERRTRTTCDALCR